MDIGSGPKCMVSYSKFDRLYCRTTCRWRGGWAPNCIHWFRFNHCVRSNLIVKSYRCIGHWRKRPCHRVERLVRPKHLACYLPHDSSKLIGPLDPSIHLLTPRETRVIQTTPPVHPIYPWTMFWMNLRQRIFTLWMVFHMIGFSHKWMLLSIMVHIGHVSYGNLDNLSNTYVGGAGTTAAGIRAGCPTIIHPFFGDQFFWASRIVVVGFIENRCMVECWSFCPVDGYWYESRQSSCISRCVTYCNDYGDREAMASAC